MRKSRKETNTTWKQSRPQVNTAWNVRGDADTSWTENGRDRRKTKSRSYMLGSFFELIKTAITDTKDGKALGIKCDPAYLADSGYMSREEANTTYKSRFRS